MEKKDEIEENLNLMKALLIGGPLGIDLYMAGLISKEILDDFHLQPRE